MLNRPTKQSLIWPAVILLSGAASGCEPRIDFAPDFGVDEPDGGTPDEPYSPTARCEFSRSAVTLEEANAGSNRVDELKDQVDDAVGQHACDWTWLDVSPGAAMQPPPGTTRATITMALRDEPLTQVTATQVGNPHVWIRDCYSYVTIPFTIHIRTDDGAVDNTFDFDGRHSGGSVLYDDMDFGPEELPGHRFTWTDGTTEPGQHLSLSSIPGTGVVVHTDTVRYEIKRMYFSAIWECPSR